MPILPSNLKSTLKTEDPSLGGGGKQVSFLNIVSVKNLLAIVDETGANKPLTISIVKEILLEKEKTTKISSAKQFGSFFNVKEYFKEFFKKPIVGSLTTFSLFQEILEENNSAFFSPLISSVLVSEDESYGNACVFKQVAKLVKNQNTLAVANSEVISEEIKSKLLVLNELGDCIILGSKVKDITAQEEINRLRIKALQSHENTMLFIQQFRIFLDKLVLLKAIIES